MHIRADWNDPMNPEFETKWDFGRAGVGGDQHRGPGGTLYNEKFSGRYFPPPVSGEIAKFTGCEFRNCHFGGANFSFHFCTFDGCGFNSRRAGRFAKPEFKEGLLILTGCRVDRCTFSNLKLIKSGFGGCKFSLATFERPLEFADVRLLNLQGLETCRGLDGVRVAPNSDLLDHDLQSVVLRMTERYVSWEQLNRFGRLPLFSVSLTALISIPLIFYIFAVYNDQIARLREILPAGPMNSPIDGFTHAIQRLQPLQIPALSIWLLISTLLLGIASSLFAIFCPARVKEFSLERWTHELGRPALHYLPYSWSKRWLRAVIAPCYILGGTGTLVILLIKLFNAGSFVFHHTSFPWWTW